MRRFLDRLCVCLHLAGWHHAAVLVGRWGSLATYTVATTSKPRGTRVGRSVGPEGPRWTTEDWHPAQPLRIIVFDPTWRSDNPGVDPFTDIALAYHAYDVN